jgi:transcriptional regulator with XRE-family HTH domain
MSMPMRAPEPERAPEREPEREPEGEPEREPATNREAVFAEPATYDPASRAQLFVTDAESLALASRRMRRNAGLSQRALAAKAGVAKTTIDRIETGALDPTIGTLLKLAAATGAGLAITGLAPTTFIFGIVEEQRDRADRHAPPHRLNKAGFGWWDTSAEPHVRKALTAHKGDLWALVSVAAARAARRY